MPIQNSNTASRKRAARSRANVSVSILQKPAPALPHERDESTDSQTAAPRQVIRQAAKDLKHGQMDTDRSAEMNQIYKKLKTGR